MASNWHFKTNLKDEHAGIEEVKVPDIKISEDIQITQKGTTQKFKDWFKAIKFKKAFKTVLKTFAITLPFVASLLLISQIKKEQSIFTITEYNLSVLLNPVATSTPTATPTSISSPNPASSATPIAKSCNSCHKKRCDGVCNKSDNRSTCSDCP